MKCSALLSYVVKENSVGLRKAGYVVIVEVEIGKEGVVVRRS